MKHLFGALLLVLIFQCPIAAMEIPGVIIRKKDTLEVVFNIPVNRMAQKIILKDIQYEIDFVDSEGVQMTLKANQAQEVRFTYEGEEIRMLSRDNFFTNGSTKPFKKYPKLFLKLEVDGPLKLFSLYDEKVLYYTTDPVTEFITGSSTIVLNRIRIQKGNGELIRPSVVGFKKDMAEYFSDCPDLIKKIESEEFQRENIIRIVNFYNSTCAQE